MEQAEQAFQDDAPIEQTQVETQEDITSEVDTNEVDTEETGETETAETEPEFIEVDYKGEKYNVPPELKDSFMRNKDYSQKTQEVAEQRRALEQQTQQFQQAAQMQSRNMEGYAQLAAIKSQLQQYDNVNWAEFSDTAPIEAQKAFIQHAQLKDAASNLGQQLQQQEAQALNQQQTLTARQIEQGKAELARDIPDWSPTMAKSISEYGLKEGVPENILSQLSEPYQVKILRKAMLYDQLNKKATTKPKTEVKPISKVKGKANAKPDPEKMSTEDWMKWRNKQIQR